MLRPSGRRRKRGRDLAPVERGAEPRQSRESAATTAARGKAGLRQAAAGGGARGAGSGGPLCAVRHSACATPRASWGGSSATSYAGLCRGCATPSRPGRLSYIVLTGSQGGASPRRLAHRACGPHTSP